MAEAKKSKARILTFGQKGEIRAISYKLLANSSIFNYQIKNQKIKLKFPYLLPEYYKYTFGAALATAQALNLNLKQASLDLQKELNFPPGRMSVFQGIKEITLIDSSYNASRATVLGALDLLKEAGQKRKKPACRRAKVFVFGDMRELGKEAKLEHQKVAQKILKTVDQLILVGPETKKHVWPIVKNKLPTTWFKTAWPAANFLKKALKGKEIVLIKGSQNTIFLEIVVKALLKYKKDQKYLCRRGKFWENKRLKLLQV